MLERFSFIKCIKIAIEHARFIVSMGNGNGRIIIIIRKWKLIQMVNIKICQLFFSSLLCPIRSVHSFPMFFCACSKSARRLRPDCINEAKKRNRRGREVDSTSLIDANRIRKCYNTWQQEEEIIHSSLSLSLASRLPLFCASLVFFVRAAALQSHSLWFDCKVESLSKCIHTVYTRIAHRTLSDRMKSANDVTSNGATV